MGEESGGKPYDLEERTERFARRVRELVRKLPRSVTNLDDVRELVRSSGSVAANYIEANEALGKKDFAMRIRISRKESKESRLWLPLVYTDGSDAQGAERDALVQEATELMNIFGSILRKFE